MRDTEYDTAYDWTIQNAMYIYFCKQHVAIECVQMHCSNFVGATDLAEPSAENEWTPQK